VIAVTTHAEALEGVWQPKEVVIAEFDSMEQARPWYESVEYREPKDSNNSFAPFRVNMKPPPVTGQGVGFRRGVSC